MSTDISLSNDEGGALRRGGLSLGFERRLADRWGLHLSGGASLMGDLTIGEDRYELDPGWMASLGGSVRVLDDEGFVPFLVIGISGAVSSAGTERTTAAGVLEEATFTATDFRASITVGKLFWQAVAPFAVARVFGGPIFWERNGEELTGSDDNHYQLGGGLLVSAFGRVNAYTEIIPLGETAISVGASVSF